MINLIIGLCMGSFVGLTYYYGGTSWCKRKYVVLKNISNMFFRQFIYIMAHRYDLLTGAKHIYENYDMAAITYSNARNEKCVVQVPFYKNSVSTMRNVKVIVKKVFKNGEIMYEDITQEPGLAYLFSPSQVGGEKFLLFEAVDIENKWNSPWKYNKNILEATEEWKFLDERKNNEKLDIQSIKVKEKEIEM